MSSERRTLRPYKGLHELEQLMPEARLKWGEAPLEPGRRRVRTREFMEEPVDLEMPSGGAAAMSDALKATGVPVDKAELVIVATSGRLKLSSVLASFRTDDLPEQVRLSESRDRPDVFRTPFSGVKITIAVVLAEDLDPQPLRASRQGTWLARAEFEVTTDLGDIGFTPQPLTDEDRDQFGLPKDCAHFFHCDGVLLPDQAETALTVYVDEELLSVLDDQASQPVAKLLQQELFVDAMRAVVSTTARDWNGSLSHADIEGSLSHRVAMAIARGADDEIQAEEILMQMRLQPEVVSARIEALVPKYAKSRIAALQN